MRCIQKLSKEKVKLAQLMVNGIDLKLRKNAEPEEWERVCDEVSHDFEDYMTENLPVDDEDEDKDKAKKRTLH